MKKNNNGAVAAEATIALTVFIFLSAFFFSVTKVYKAQDLIGHATYQTAQALAIDAFAREKIGEGETTSDPTAADAKGIPFTKAVSNISDFMNWLTGKAGFSIPGVVTDLYRSLADVKDLDGLFRKTMAYSIADTEKEADALLKAWGVVDGLNGIDFGGSKIENNNITVNVKYKIKIGFAAFWKDGEFTLTTKACCRAFGDIDGTNEIPETSESATTP